MENVLPVAQVDETFSAGVAREITEMTIDELFKQLQGGINRKPRRGRDKAHNHFLTIIKIKKPITAKFERLNGLI